jgi:anti-sigma28 factor (negative regulator of flagellin synthesis)
MKIENNLNIDSVLPASKQPDLDKTAKERETGQANRTAETVENHKVSELARRMSAAKEVMDSLPDVRADKVAQAKARLLKGYYDTPEAREILTSRLATILKDTGV